MDRQQVQDRLLTVKRANSVWAEVQTKFTRDIDKTMRLLLHEAAAAYMSPEDVARFSGFTPKRVRLFMKKFGLDYRRGRTLLAKSAADALERNTEITGEVPPLTSMSAYLPRLDVARQVDESRAVDRQRLDRDTVAKMLKDAYSEGRKDEREGESHDPVWGANFILNDYDTGAYL